MNQVRTGTIRIPLTRREAEMAGWALAFAALTGIGAILRIPLSPVPVTLQVFFVLLAGLALGPVWGPMSQVTYILMGLCGAPFFAAFPHAGPAVLFGPTGGYLWGFVLGALATGIIGEKAKRIDPASLRLPATLVACLAGILAIYACGTTWLAVWLGAHDLSAGLAYQLGVKPFIAVDLLKGLAAAFLVLGGSTVFARRRRKRLG